MIFPEKGVFALFCLLSNNKYFTANLGIGRNVGAMEKALVIVPHALDASLLGIGSKKFLKGNSFEIG
ncbi:MAG: hypothetical protein ACTSRP_13250 [Candidatus Helarchaeota archaeon]